MATLPMGCHRRNEPDAGGYVEPMAQVTIYHNPN